MSVLILKLGRHCFLHLGKAEASRVEHSSNSLLGQVLKYLYLHPQCDSLPLALQLRVTGSQEKVYLIYSLLVKIKNIIMLIGGVLYTKRQKE